MKDLGADTGEILVKLELAAYARTLPERARLASRQLYRRLSSPIRVAILGHPQSGKTELLNLIAGERILEPGNRLPSVELAFGEGYAAWMTDPEGVEHEIGFDQINEVTREEAGLLRLEAPLQILAQVTLTEVVSEGTAEDERAALQWASERSDLALWCSQAFSEAEEWLWSTVPERLKDHGFLILTKADELIRDGVLHDRIAELDDIVAEQFHSLIPVATRQGMDSLVLPGGRDEDAFRASGARALLDALIDHIEQGQRADLDAAMLLISRFAAQLDDAEDADVPAQPRAPAAAPTGTTLYIPPAETPIAATPSEIIEPGPAPFAAPETVVQDEAVALEESLTADAQAEDPDPRPEALAILDLAAQGLTEVSDHNLVLAQCVDIATEVAEHLAMQPIAHPDARLAIETAQDVSEMILLMQLEQTEAAAADAVTLLLQLARELEHKAAA